MLSDIEIIHNQFCKYVLGLGPRSVNMAALAECHGVADALCT